MRGLTVLAILGVVAGWAMPTQAAETCTDNGRACQITTAMTYVESLWAANGQTARLAPNVRRTHNGGKRPEEGAELIRTQIAKERLNNYRNVRLTVDEKKGDVFVFWITRGPQPQTAHIAERIRVKDGWITEIEAFFWLDERPADQVTSVWPDATRAAEIAPPKVDIGPCAGARRDCLIAVANTYLDSLLKADGAAVKASPTVRRTLNGNKVYEGEAVLRKGVSSERLAYRKNYRLFVDEAKGEVMALWLTSANPPAEPSTAHVIERIKIEKGLITEIEVFYPLEQGTRDGTSGWPDEP
ncbi:MAG: hypothetical protein K2P94_07440 [Rhodospirillaceae bacterium]|nr:hypothetical protein [Rhodospirillaceae bacterium]